MNTSDFSLRLLQWYERNGRELPWRGTQDAYRVWVSEVILQQTRVAQGYDYFLRFVERFPTVEALAAASEDEVLRLWQGLGYYTRARNLRQAARQIVEMGGFPTDYATIRRLKGVGDYTAAAIASLAFGLPHAVVDGNVYRVLSRHFGIDTPIDTTGGRKLFAAMAQEMLVVGRPADYNQAIMDFGALVCTPKSPQCEACPLMETCQARTDGRVEQLPQKAHVTRVRDRFFTYVYIRFAHETILQQRPAGDIWQGLYQMPMRESERPMTLAEVEKWLGEYGRLKKLCTDHRHQLSHQRLHADLYLLKAGHRPSMDGDWINETQFDEYAVPRLVEELLKCVSRNF